MSTPTPHIITERQIMGTGMIMGTGTIMGMGTIILSVVSRPTLSICQDSSQFRVSMTGFDVEE